VPCPVAATPVPPTAAVTVVTTAAVSTVVSNLATTQPLAALLSATGKALPATTISGVGSPVTSPAGGAEQVSVSMTLTFANPTTVTTVNGAVQLTQVDSYGNVQVVSGAEYKAGVVRAMASSMGVNDNQVIATITHSSGVTIANRRAETLTNHATATFIFCTMTRASTTLVGQCECPAGRICNVLPVVPLVPHDASDDDFPKWGIALCVILPILFIGGIVVAVVLVGGGEGGGASGDTSGEGAGNEPDADAAAGGDAAGAEADNKEA